MKHGGLISVLLWMIATVHLASATSLMAAETITDSIKNGKVNGEVKIWYQTNDNDANKHIFDSENSWFDGGLSLGYLTDAYKGFKVGAVFYGVDDLGAYENWANRSMMAVNHTDTEAWLGEAYVSYDFKNTMAKLGRQTLSSPLLNSDSWAIFPNNFEGVLLANSDLPNTKLFGSYVWEERWLQSQDFEQFYDGVFMLGAVNQSFKDTTFTAYVYSVNEDTLNYNTGDPSWDTLAAYLESTFKVKPFDIGIQYMRMDPDRSGFDETDAIAAKISTRIAGFTISTAYSYVCDGTLLAAKFSDHRIKSPIYTETIGGDADIAGRPDTESVRVSAEVCPIETLYFMAAYGYYSMDNSKYYTAIDDGDCSQADLVCKYTGVKYVTLWGGVWYSDHEGIGAYNGLNGEDLITFRCWASFKF